MTLRIRIRQRLSALGLSMRAASLKAGLGTHFLRDLLADEGQSPKSDNLAKLAVALETTPEWLLSARGDRRKGIPVMGIVGAGSHYKPHSDQGVLDFVDSPPDAEDIAGAAIVRGDSAYPVFRDQDILYFGEWRDDVEAFIGKDVIAELDDGQMLVKCVDSRVGPGAFSLSSHNAPPIRNATVIRVAPIMWIKRP